MRQGGVVSETFRVEAVELLTLLCLGKLSEASRHIYPVWRCI